MRDQIDLYDFFRENLSLKPDCGLQKKHTHSIDMSFFCFFFLKELEFSMICVWKLLCGLKNQNDAIKVITSVAMGMLVETENVEMWNDQTVVSFQHLLLFLTYIINENCIKGK